MSESASFPRSDAPHEPLLAADTIARETLAERNARLSIQLADLLEQLDGMGMQRGIDFLRAMAQSSAPELALHQRIGAARLERIASAFRLAPVELDLIALAAMPDRHEGYAGVLQSLHPRSEPRPSLGLAAQLLTTNPIEREALQRVIDEGPACAVGILVCRDDAPFFNRTLELGPGVAALLRGSTSWPAPLRPFECDPDDVDTTALHSWLDSDPARRAIAALREQAQLDVVLIADELPLALDRARVLAAVAGRRSATFEIDTETFSNSADDLLARIHIHTVARGCVPIFALSHVGSATPEHRGPSFAGYPGPVLRCTTRDQHHAPDARPLLAVECTRTPPLALRDVWAEQLPELAEHAEHLASRFPIEPARIRELANDLHMSAQLSGDPITLADLFPALRLRSGAALKPGMRARRPTTSWDRLVLPTERIEQLREAVARVRHQSRVIDDWGMLEGRPGARGVRMLFCGPPGTGKTLAAEVLAHELDTDLLIIDLSRLVSKWIGETEKNLAEVFAGAERSRAVLLFDEADALFGKRTEVSDAHDRYANLETAYLLTRLEAYDGLAVLATNMRRNVDPAFVRRLEFVIDFELPGRAERLELWRAHLPQAIPLASDVDLRVLADFYPLAGGLIRNAATAAAFLAAADPESHVITCAHLLRAIRREYEKNGTAFPGTPRFGKP